MALTAKKVYAILKRQISDMEAKIKTPIIYRGTVATADLLPLNPDIGDMYNIESKSVYGEAGMNVAWNGVVWDTMGAPIDMSLYIKSNELADWVKQQNKPTYTAEEVGALPADTKIPSKTSELQNDAGFLTKIPDNYLSGTDKTLSVSGKAADAKATGDKITELSADISNKLNKNQGSENSGKIAGINESGDIVPMFPVSVDYNEETNCLEFGSDQKMELNKGINLDSTLTKTGYAADAGTVGEITNSLKEDISTKITKFYASSQGETHLTDSYNGKIQDMMLYGKSEQKQYSGKNLIDCTLNTSTVYNAAYTKLDVGGRYSVIGTPSDQSGVNFYTGTLEPGTYTLSCKMESGSLHGNINIVITDVIANCMFNNGHVSFTLQEASKINLWNDYGATYNTNLNATFAIQIEKGSTATSYEPYTGGIPSPNPDYPQEIKSVVNPTVKMCGKNLLNYDAWSQTNCANGKAVYENNGVTITALMNDAFTNYDMSVFPTTARIPVNVGETITISWDEPLNKEGRVYVFGNGSTSNMTYANNSSSKQLKYTIPSGVTFITFRFGVRNAGDTISYRNIQIELGSAPTTFEPYHEQTVTLPYTLNAIPVSSGGNVTIDGQQYIADYVDVERGKLVKTVDSSKLDNTQSIVGKTEWLLAEPQEIDLTTEEITAFKALATYYPTTNISVNSEQLDGYTVFNYPISMENGWNYVKQQIGDTRDYIYDMDARTQDTDLQAAEAYVNSEYAVALTELEV